MALRQEPPPRLTYTLADDRDGNARVLIGNIALPCPGVALRLNAVIDCRPGEDRMPPVTIDFLTKLPPPEPQQQPAAAAPAPQSEITTAGDAPPAAEEAKVAGRFTCNSGEFILFNQLQKIEAMVAAAGLPRECAPSVEEFCSQSARNATNTFYKAVNITVEADKPSNLAFEDDEDEEVPDGAVVGECTICYKVYLVGGDTSVKLPCSHVFHRGCLERWTFVRRTCPYCRGPVPLEEEPVGEYWREEDHPEHDGNDVYGEEYEYSSTPVDGDDISGEEYEYSWTPADGEAWVILDDSEHDGDGVSGEEYEYSWTPADDETRLILDVSEHDGDDVSGEEYEYSSTPADDETRFILDVSEHDGDDISGEEYEYTWTPADGETRAILDCSEPDDGDDFSGEEYEYSSTLSDDETQVTLDVSEHDGDDVSGEEYGYSSTPLDGENWVILDVSGSPLSSTLGRICNTLSSTWSRIFGTPPSTSSRICTRALFVLFVLGNLKLLGFAAEQA
ncbi:hypothetical protein ACP70R_027398 [Stipagrostis hirtigluma subsp. patula]